MLALFDSMNVMNRVEQKARYEIQLEQYAQCIEIVSLVLENIVKNQVLATSFKYQQVLIQNVVGLKEIYQKDYIKYSHVATQTIEKISAFCSSLSSSCEELASARDKANSMSKLEDRAQMYAKNVLPIFDEIRTATDGLESIVEDSSWPLAKYRELLFLR